MRLIILLAACVLSACSAPPLKVGPKTDLAPVRASNTATRKSIGESRVQIKSAQANARAGDKHLQSAEDKINELLK